MCNFKIGQRIVAVITHSQGKFKRGDEFVVVGLRGPLCGHYPALVDVGVRNEIIPTRCPYCHNETESTSISWFCVSAFRPLQSSYTEEELASVDISPLIEELELETV